MTKNKDGPAAEPMVPEDEWDRMGNAFRGGAIVHASRPQLERYLFALATVQIRADFNQQRAHQMGETIRLLLARQDSIEASRINNQPRFALIQSAR